MQISAQQLSDDQEKAVKAIEQLLHAVKDVTDFVKASVASNREEAMQKAMEFYRKVRVSQALLAECRQPE